MLTDNSPVNTTELARFMRCCRETVNRHKRQGYCFEFGNRTTAGTLQGMVAEESSHERESRIKHRSSQEGGTGETAMN